MRLNRQELIEEFEHTWDRHHGSITIAARILNMTPDALSRRLYRYKADGWQGQFRDDTKRYRTDRVVA